MFINQEEESHFFLRAFSFFFFGQAPRLIFWVFSSTIRGLPKGRTHPRGRRPHRPARRHFNASARDPLLVAIDFRKHPIGPPLPNR